MATFGIETTSRPLRAFIGASTIAMRQLGEIELQKR